MGEPATRTIRLRLGLDPGGAGPGTGSGGWTEPDGTIPGGAPLSDDPPPPDTDPTNPGYTPSPDFSGAAVAVAAPGDQPPADTGMGGGGGGPPDLPSGRTVTYNLDKAGNRSGSNAVVDTGVPTSYTPNILNDTPEWAARTM